jgi:PIN domain nuclease of toxin-antitoxin system
MRFLTDTHILLWYLEGDKALSAERHELIEDLSNEVFVSIVSLWEMAIKISLNKLAYSYSLDEIIENLESRNIYILPMSPKDTIKVSTLPFHHRDPFDRMIIVQSQLENCQ